MTWHLAHNLQVRVDAAKSCYPGLVVGEVGDLAHQTEASDHNPDARGIVHAVDFMAAAGTSTASAILAWLLAHPADLQYVIHNREIYTRAAGFKPAPYHGTDPHTNHVHASGKHGSVGRNAATGTGYDTAAEAMSPAGSPCASSLEADMPTAADVWKADVIPNTAGDSKTNPTTQAAFALGDVRTRLIELGGVVASQSKQIAALVGAVAAMAKGGTSIDTAAVVNAVDAVGKTESDAVAELQSQIADLQARLAAAGGALTG